MKRIKEERPGNPALASPGAADGLTLEQLRLFLAAARQGNFTQAAESCYLSQSAFSRQIQALERALGTAVFDRVGRRVRLNDAGRELERRASEIVARIERLPAEIAPAGRGTSGTVRLGANMTIGIRLLPAWLAAFQQRFPDIHVTLLLRTTSEMAPLMRGEAIDASIQEYPDDAALEGQPPLKVHLTYRDEVWVIGPKGISPELRPGPQARWFGNPDANRRKQLAQMGFAIDDATRVPGAEVALKFVEAGMGYACIPGFMAQQSLKLGRITRMSATLTRRIAFVTLGDRPPSPCVQRLMEFLKPRWQAEAERQRQETRK
ncbi:MAG: hypothetical protein AMXMBFR7_51820 [Planctomycetota bacterium]